MVSTWFSLYSLLVRTRTRGEPREIAEVCAPPVREPEMAGAFACACKQLVCTCLCVRICVSMSIAHACIYGCSISNVSLLSIIAGHISDVLMSTLSTQQQHSNNNKTATTSKVCPMNRGARVGAASITDKPENTPAMIKPDLLPTTFYLLRVCVRVRVCARV